MKAHRISYPALLLTALLLTALLLTALLASSIYAADWSAYRGGAARTGFVEDTLPEKLSLRWKHKAPNPPQPAWPRSKRMPFDRAFQAIVANGQVFFGSSVDGSVRALDLASGEHRWTYYTEGPIRFAPVHWKDRVIVASDDGYLVALASKDGKLLWRKRGGPNHRSILGNGRLISKWPARGGPAIVDDVVYFAAGIWPSDGIYLYALNAKTGALIWKNDDSGGIYMPQPHGGASAKSGVSAQGYLVVSGDRLFVPTGRAVPAAFDRKTGKFKYFHLQKYGHKGGAPTMAIGKMFFNSGLSFDSGSGKQVSRVGTGPLAATRDGMVVASRNSVAIYRWQDVTKPDRKGRPVKTRGLKSLGKVKKVASGASLIVASDKIISAGPGQVDVIDAKSQKVVASMKVDGIPYSLAVSHGNLIVSTDQGVVYCFGKPGAKPKEPRDSLDLPLTIGKLVTQAADEIIRRSNVRSGYCLDLGCGTGSLSYALAKRTSLRIYAVEDTPQKVETARRNLIRAGVYGSRVTVHLRKLSDTGYPNFFANLIVSERSLTGGSVDLPQKELKRLQRPFGGVVCLGPPGSIKTDVRKALTGAGSWTHQYANAGNTLNSGDSLIHGRLGMLWFRDVDINVPQRHGRAPAPLFHHGRLYHQGIDSIIAIDAYNGHEIWRYKVKGLLAAYNGDELMGTAGTGSNMCVGDDSVFVRHEGRCLQLNAASGKLRREIKTPPQPDGKPGVWGYIATVKGVLYGTVANQGHVVTYRYRATTGNMAKLLTESHSIFAVDTKSGKQLWHHKAKDSLRHNAIAIGGGRVYLIDRPVALFDRKKKRSKVKKHPLGRLVALDARTGKIQWSKEKQIYGTMLVVSEKHNKVLMSYQPTSFRLDSEIGGRLAAFQSDDGERRWDIKASYRSRPMINDYTIYADGGSWDLLTGEVRPFNFKRSYGCGILAGCQSMMLFRSATLGYFDLTGKKQTTKNYGGVRPGCWVNAIPAGGVVLIPDASAGCQCSYLNKAWFALQGEAK